MKTLVLLLAVTAPMLCAQTLYKSVGPDGKAVYSDKPPAEGQLQKTIKAETLPSTVLPAASGTVLYAASWCGYCRQARAYLKRTNIPYQDIDVETPQGKLAFAAAGGGGVPLIVVKGQPLRGYSELAYDGLFAPQR